MGRLEDSTWLDEMYAESAFRLGPSATLLPDKTCGPQKITRSLSQRVNLPRGRPERVFDGKTCATLEYQSTRKGTVDADLVGQLNYTPANFDTGALNQLAQSDSTKQNSVADSLSLPNGDRMKSVEALAGLRQGTVIGDGKVYRQTFVIRSYEVGSDGKTSMDTIVSLFQVQHNLYGLVFRLLYFMTGFRFLKVLSGWVSTGVQVLLDSTLLP